MYIDPHPLLCLLSPLSLSLSLSLSLRQSHIICRHAQKHSLLTHADFWGSRVFKWVRFYTKPIFVSDRQTLWCRNLRCHQSSRSDFSFGQVLIHTHSAICFSWLLQGVQVKTCPAHHKTGKLRWQVWKQGPIWAMTYFAFLINKYLHFSLLNVGSLCLNTCSFSLSSL